LKRDENLDNRSLLVSVNELHKLAAAGEDIFLLDVRTVPELEAGRLVFTSLQIPYDRVEHKLNLLPVDKATKIYCFCRTGRRSGITTEYLRSIGYENAFNVEGGIVSWQESGYKIISGKL
jgi:rhodanese-related sulfurtransferase